MPYKQLPPRHALFDRLRGAEQNLEDLAIALEEIAQAATRGAGADPQLDEAIEEASFDAYHSLMEWQREYWNELWRLMGGIA